MATPNYFDRFSLEDLTLLHKSALANYTMRMESHIGVVDLRPETVAQLALKYREQFDLDGIELALRKKYADDLFSWLSDDNDTEVDNINVPTMSGTNIINLVKQLTKADK